MTESVERYIAANELYTPGAGILVGLSGGVDSMVLLDVLCRLGANLEAVHINYGLRGGASDRDENLVRSTCDTKGIALTVMNASDQMDSVLQSGSLQAHARRIRYDEFSALATEQGLGVVAVGHHADDQVETVLMNIMRRSGLDGLAGMRPSRPFHNQSDIRLIRPLLACSRVSIERYAKHNDIPWRKDASNEDKRFLRARVRHHVLPALKQAAGPGVVVDLKEMSREIQLLVDSGIPMWLPDDLREESIRDGCIPLVPLMALDPVVRSWLLLRVLRLCIPGAPVRKTTLTSIENLLRGPNGKHIHFRQGSIWKERDHLRFSRRVDHGTGGTDGKRQTDPIRISIGTKERNFVAGPFGQLSWKITKGMPDRFETDSTEILVDRDALSNELLIRPWQSGDRFQPFGMEGTQKVKSFLTERRIPTRERGYVHVLCDGDMIVWVIGQRMDERYRVRDQTRRIVRFLYQPVKG